MLSLQSRSVLVLFFFALTLPTGALAQGECSGFIAATWDDQAVHFLDAGLNDTGSFATGSSLPNGIATDGNLIWTGHFTTTEVIAYDQSGVEQFRWSAPLSGLQAMEYISPNELAIYNAANGNVEFYNPFTGVFVRSIPGATVPFVEGIAWDGTTLWQLNSNLIYGTDINTGATLLTLPNAAAGCLFGGSGLADSGTSELTLACTDGRWFTVSKADGSVITSGSNGLNMYALKCGVLNTPPVASCIESVNPAGKNTPPAGSTTLPGPKGGENEDGFYELVGEDNEDGSAPVFVTNASGSATFGPFSSGSVVKITEAPGRTPTAKPMGGPDSAVAAHITLDSDAFVFAVDSSGEESPVVSCLVPPPPK